MPPILLLLSFQLGIVPHAALVRAVAGAFSRDDIIPASHVPKVSYSLPHHVAFGYH